MNNRHALLVTAAVVMVTLAGCTGEAADDQAPPPPEVSIATVLVQEVEPWNEFTGRVEAVESVSLRPRVSGHIERVNYIEGTEVTRGEVLFVIDARTYRATLDRAEAELESAQAREILANTELERARKLLDTRAIPDGEFDQRQATHAQAQANVRAVQATVEAATLDLEFTQVRAPISGRTGRALVTPGNLVSADPNATLLTTIVSLDPIHVYFEGDEQTYLRFLAMAHNDRRSGGHDTGQPVRVGLAGEAGYPYKGELDFIDNHVDPETGTIRARARIPNPDRILTPGMFARVQLLTGDPFEAILIDDKAVLTDQDRKYVYVVGDDNLAMRRDIRTGRLIDGLRIIESGLAPGDRIIVHGVQKIFFPGMPVQAHEITMGDPPPAAGPPGNTTH